MTWATLRPILFISLSITFVAGVVAYAYASVADVRFLFWFVILRWICVTLTLGTALLWKYRDGQLWIPSPLRSPLTPLFLTIESILVDIVSATTH